MKRAKTELDSCQADYIASIEKDLNNRLDRLNVEVCGASRTAPVIDIVDSSHYTYTIPKDGGAGSRNRGMFLFDVALLEGTLLPAFAHDTNAIKQVEDGTVLRLIEVYARQAKQVFLAIDKTESLTEDGEPAVLTDATVLRLGEGHELFGSYWPTRNQVRQ